MSSSSAVAGDYGWFREVGDLSKGFCFVWVRRVRASAVVRRMGAKELERIGWQQMVGAGDGQSGGTSSSGKLYFGVARLDDDWSLVVEDNGGLGVEDGLLRPLSDGTVVVCLYRAADGSGRFAVMEDGRVSLEFDPTVDSPAVGTRVGEFAGAMKAAGVGVVRAPQERIAAGFALAERVTGVPLSLSGLQERTYLFSVVPTGQ